MSELPFKVIRWIAIPVALLVAFSWFLVPSSIDVARAVESNASAERLVRKDVEYVLLQMPNGLEIQIQCSSAPTLCKSPLPVKMKTLRVWLQDAGPILGSWVVAAEFNGQEVVSPKAQGDLFRTAKIMSGLGSLAALAIALILLRFPPTRRAVDRSPSVQPFHSEALPDNPANASHVQR